MQRDTQAKSAGSNQGAEELRELSNRELEAVHGGWIQFAAGAVGFAAGAAGGYHLLKKAGWDWDYSGR